MKSSPSFPNQFPIWNLGCFKWFKNTKGQNTHHFNKNYCKNVFSELIKALSSAFSIRSLSNISKFIKENSELGSFLWSGSAKFIHTSKPCPHEQALKAWVISIMGNACITLLKYGKILTARYLKVTDLQKMASHLSHNNTPVNMPAYLFSVSKTHHLFRFLFFKDS